MSIVVGIDEVGRGPLAGPVTVGIVVCEKQVYLQLKRNRKLPPRGFDSKKLTPQTRESYAHYLKFLAQENKIRYAIVHVSHAIIDTKGLTFAIRKATSHCLRKLRIDPEQSAIFLDGGLKAPKQFLNQVTIIKGDEKEKIIAWASILAKVARDKLMTCAARKFPEYGFEQHKGYGTRTHRQAIRKIGLSSIHRKSFCGKLTIYQ